MAGGARGGGGVSYIGGGGRICLRGLLLTDVTWVAENGDVRHTIENAADILCGRFRLALAANGGAGWRI